MKQKINYLILFTRGFIYGLQFRIVSALQFFATHIYEQRRALIIFVFGVLEVFILLNFSSELKSFFELHSNWIGTSTVAMLIASPIAYLIWTFRNLDKKKELQHSEEAIRQSDFHKIEEWATTLSASDSALQIAAIYQLLPYLKGVYGKRFIRPAMEIYRSLLSSWCWETDDIADIDVHDVEIEKPENIRVLHGILNEEHEYFRALGKNNIYPINTWRPLDRLNLKGIYLHMAIFSSVSMRGVNLKLATIEGTDFCSSDLHSAMFQRSNLIVVNFQGANLCNAEFQESNLVGINFHGADLKGANFTDAKKLTSEMFVGAKNIDKAIGIVFE